MTPILPGSRIQPASGKQPANGVIRHFWSGEMGPATADPGQDPRGAPDLNPLWTILDFLPEGRGANWYPKLDYAADSVTPSR